MSALWDPRKVPLLRLLLRSEYLLGLCLNAYSD